MLLRGFLDSLHRYPERPALFVQPRTLTYRELSNEASSLTHSLRQLGPDPAGVIGLLALDSVEAYAGALAILASGHGFVPVNFQLPVKRVARMLTIAETRTLIVGEEYADRLAELLPALPGIWRLVLPATADRPDLRRAFSQHRWLFRSDLSSTPPEFAAGGVEGLAYVMFTSGSTGLPKGIWVTQDNVRCYLDFVGQEYAFTAEDRFSQAFPLTFDPSIHDMFACWNSGAALYCLPKKHRLIPGSFIREHQLTCWFSAPSIVMAMSQTRALRPGLFPSLRLSLFIGEQLYSDWARQWQAAAPNSRIDNVYGPTETTVAIFRHRWQPTDTGEVVPIGRIFPGQRYRILDPLGKSPPSGEPGELYLSGSQVSLGYRNDPDQQRESFKRLGSDRWYRTGDLVTERDGILTFRGRTDNQIKIRSQRVELGEIDTVLRRITGCTLAVTLAWPIEHNRAENLYTFLLTPRAPFDAAAALRECQAELPAVMVPRFLWAVDRFPLNANGKVDRTTLTEWLGERLAEEPGP